MNDTKLNVIWDLDGTLINSEQEFLNALIKSVRDCGLSECDQRAPFRVGPTIDRILDAAFSPDVMDSNKKYQIIAAFRKNYDNCGFNNTPAFDGIEQILADKAFVHHIVTNKPDLATGRILQKLCWTGYFASVITPYSFMKTENDKKKTKTELFALCMSHSAGESFVGVGDMDTDAKAALANNIPAVGVLWGTGTKEDLVKCGCTYIAKTVSELVSLLESL